jgi:hypothetical protein
MASALGKFKFAFVAGMLLGPPPTIVLMTPCWAAALNVKHTVTITAAAAQRTDFLKFILISSLLSLVFGWRLLGR